LEIILAAAHWRTLAILDSKMKNEWDSKECFRQQAEDMLHGEPLYKCLKCSIFDKCHKITIAACLQSISTGMDLLIENGLATNKLMGFAELNKLAEIEMKKEH
jgi:hypothetical protein